MVKFYTLPPLSIPYEYIIINANNPNRGFTYIRRHSHIVKSIIIDSGIEIFRNPSIFDYPPNHMYKIVRIYNKLRRLAPNSEIYATVADYCDDYHPKRLWISEERTNIERTVENILEYTTKFVYINWLIPIQGWHKQPRSIERCVKLLENKGIIDRYSYFAIGNLCVETDINIIYETVKMARSLLPDKQLHVFGLKLKALPYVKSFINSFDSFAWTRPVTSKLRAKWSCKNTDERIRFFNAWLERYKHYMKQKPLITDVATRTSITRKL